jgi:uncharacterized membrane protein SirB2
MTMEKQDPNFPTARPEQAASSARGGAVTTPLRITQLVITSVMLLASTYLLIYANQRGALWWWTGFALVAIACVLSLVAFRERT